MDLVDFSSISFDSGMDIKCLCKYLNQLVGVGIRYDTSTIRNTRWLWLVTDNMLAVNSDRVLNWCGEDVCQLCIWFPQSGGGN